MLQAKKKILVIDDNEDTLELVRELLESVAFECFTAKTAMEGLETAIRIKPQLILLDLMLPQMSGFGVMRQIKNHPELKNIPIVVLTALGDKDVAEEAIDLGAVGYLRKATGTKELLEMVREYVLPSALQPT